MDDEPLFCNDEEKKETALGCLGLIVILFLCTTPMNFWYMEDSAMAELQQDRPTVTNVIYFERNLVDYSKVMVREGNLVHEICFDTNVFFWYTFKECPSENDWDPYFP